MHEFAIAEHLLKTVLAEIQTLSQPPPRLLKVRVVVGVLQGIVPESLSLAYELLSRDTAAAGSVLEIESVPAHLECADCGWQGEAAHLEYACAGCGGVQVKLTGGRDLYLDSLEVENESDHDPSLPGPDGSQRGVGGTDPGAGSPA